MVADIPDKLFFKIGEVAQIASLRPSVLRYWETEFDALRPGKSRTGQRLYTKKDLELLFEIKRLLYSEKLTIEGARRKLNSMRKRNVIHLPVAASSPNNLREVIEDIRRDLQELRNCL